jgi:hypothetical protein
MAAGGLLLFVWGIVARSGSDAGGIAAGTSIVAGAIALGIGGLVLGVTLAYVLPNRSRASR